MRNQRHGLTIRYYLRRKFKQDRLFLYLYFSSSPSPLFHTQYLTQKLVLIVVLKSHMKYLNFYLELNPSLSIELYDMYIYILNHDLSELI